MRLFKTAIGFAASLLVACGPDCSLVATPNGTETPKACIHEVPSGAHIEETDAGITVVTLNGEVIETWGPCPCSNAKK